MNQLLDPKNINGKLNVAKFPLNSPQEYQFDKSTPWVRSILLELNENVENKLPEQYLEDSSLDITLRIEKKHKGTYGEYLIVNAQIDTTFYTQCVRTLNEMQDQLSSEFKACVIDDIHEKGEELEDQVDIFMDNDVYELHFYDNRVANIREMIHEQIYMNINQYPVSDYDAELPWAKETSSTKQ